MEEKLIMITGSTSGIGLETAKGLASEGHKIIMACRDIQKAEKIKLDIIHETKNEKIDIIFLDLSSLASVREFAKDFENKYSYLDVLINNAGLFSSYHEKTVDDFENTIGINYFASFLLTFLLLPFLKSAKSSRIINVASKAAYYAKLDFEDLRHNGGYSGFPAYAASKLAQVYFTIKLSEILLPFGITVNAVHPGSVATNIWNGKGILLKIMGPLMKLFSISPKKGAKTVIFAASSDSILDITGKLFYNEVVMPYSKLCTKREAIEDLYYKSLEIVGLNKINF